MKRMVVTLALLVALPWHSTAIASSEADDVNAQLRDKLFNHCDMVFHCASTKILDIYPDKTIVHDNETFMFSLKGGQLLVPKRRSLLGDGTVDYTLTSGGCDKVTGKLTDGPLGGVRFEAEMWKGRWVEFSANNMVGIDASGDSVRYQTRIWYAQCESFE